MNLIKLYFHLYLLLNLLVEIPENTLLWKEVLFISLIWLFSEFKFILFYFPKGVIICYYCQRLFLYDFVGEFFPLLLLLYCISLLISFKFIVLFGIKDDFILWIFDILELYSIDKEVLIIFLLLHNKVNHKQFLIHHFHYIFIC